MHAELTVGQTSDHLRRSLIRNVQGAVAEAVESGLFSKEDIRDLVALALGRHIGWFNARGCLADAALRVEHLLGAAAEQRGTLLLSVPEGTFAGWVPPGDALPDEDRWTLAIPVPRYCSGRAPFAPWKAALAPIVMDAFNRHREAWGVPTDVREPVGLPLVGWAYEDLVEASEAAWRDRRDADERAELGLPQATSDELTALRLIEEEHEFEARLADLRAAA